MEENPIYIGGTRFRVFDVPRDGNCLFHAFRYAMTESLGENSAFLRAAAVRVMKTEWENLKQYTDKGDGRSYASYDVYAADMSKDRIWAGSAEAAALGIEYGRRVRIFQDGKLVAMFNPEGEMQADLLFVRSENHYKCLMEDKTPIPGTPRVPRDDSVIYDEVRHAFPEDNYDLDRNDGREVIPYDYDEDIMAGCFPESFPIGSSKVRSLPIIELPAIVDKKCSLGLNTNLGRHYMWAAVYKGEVVHGTPAVSLGEMTFECTNNECGAVFYEAEKLFSSKKAPSWCCGDKVKCILKEGARFKPISDQCVVELYTGNSEMAVHFQENIIQYNHALSCAVPVANYDSRQLRKGRVICVNGRVTFEFDTCISRDMQEGQLYFAEMTRSLINRRVLRSEAQLRSDVMMTLERYLRSHNDMIRTFEMAGNLQRRNPIERVSLLINPHRDGFRVTDREFLDNDCAIRPPGSNFVAAAYIGQRLHYKYDVALFPRGSTGDTVPCKVIHEASPSLDALLYPLIHLHSEDPWVEVVAERAREKRPRREFASTNCGTLREYYSSRIMIRPDTDTGILFKARGLFQQWLCDAAAKIEDNNLNFAEANQDELQVCQLDSLKRFVQHEAENVGKRPGRLVIIPKNIQTSERSMFNNYLDSITITMHTAAPTFLWTFTTNPRWPEIVRILRERGLGDHEYYNAPDVVVRSYLARLNIAMSDVINKGIYGRVLAYSGVHEFQSTMLPHFHMAVILDPADVPQTADDIDAMVCAEIPSIETDTDAHYHVMKHMIHRPCDGSSPDYKNPLCRPGGVACKSGFPFPFRDHTILTNKGPLLRRRETNPIWSLKFKCLVDNRWVVPYPPKQAVRCGNHLNVMYCGANLCYKYLYGYFTKESRGQCVQGGMLRYFRNQDSAEVLDWDEIRHFQDLRVIGPFEAIYKLLSVPITRMSHSVVSLPVHLPGQQYTYYRGDYHIAAEIGGKSKLQGWFDLNKTDKSVSHLLYSEIVSRFKWEKGAWIPKEPSTTLGRLMHVNPSPRNMELFFLRLLLLNRPGITSFKDILTVEGVVHSSFQKACKAIGR